MKCKGLIIAILSLVAMPATAQPPHFDDLVILFADGSYEKLLKEAEKYTMSDKTANEPLPYFYLARANFEMSKDGDFAESFPRAFNDAIGFAGKCMKKDKEGFVYEEHIDFFTDLKVACVEECTNLVELQDFNRLRGSILKIQRFDDKDVGSWFLMTACQYRIKDKGGAKITLVTANEKLNAVTSTEKWRSVDFALFRMGVIEYAKYLYDMQMTEAYKDILGRTKQWLENDEEFMAFYNELINR